jgi:REP element-mobilizing transposase RayT
MRPAGYQALRRGRVSLAGQPYLLTTVCAGRRRVFDDFHAACTAARIIGGRRLWGDATLLAWVLMPDHWHGLVVLGADRPLSAVMQRMKSVTARDVALATGLDSLWQRGFHDRAVRSDEDLRVSARYVVANPLRAGLVERLGDYPFWDSAWGEAAVDDPFD